MRPPLRKSAKKKEEEKEKKEGDKTRVDPSPRALSDGDGLINANQPKGLLFFLPPPHPLPSAAINRDKFLLASPAGRCHRDFG